MNFKSVASRLLKSRILPYTFQATTAQFEFDTSNFAHRPNLHIGCLPEFSTGQEFVSVRGISRKRGHAAPRRTRETCDKRIPFPNLREVSSQPSIMAFIVSLFNVFGITFHPYATITDRARVSLLYRSLL